MTMAGKRGVSDLVVAARKTGLFARLKRGANFALVGAGLGAVACVFLPLVPLIVGLGIGGVGGIVIAKKTGKK